MLVKIISAPKKNQHHQTYDVISSTLHLYENEGPSLFLEFAHGPTRTRSLSPGDTVYTMNDSGKTIDKFVCPAQTNAIKFEFNRGAWNAYAKQHNMEHYRSALSKQTWDNLDTQTQRDYLDMTGIQLPE